MKGPFLQLLLSSVVCLVGLWFGIKRFVGSEEDDVFRVTGHSRYATPAALPAEAGPPGDEAVSNTPSAGPEDTEAADAGTANSVVSPQSGENGDVVSTDNGSLSDDELQAREAARRQKLLELGIIPVKAPKPTIAIDVKLEMPERCEGVDIAAVPVGVKFRFESSIIKGESLNDLESLVALYRECKSGRFMLTQNPLGRTDATGMLTEMRFDEIKYFFIQHSVSIDAVQFPEK